MAKQLLVDYNIFKISPQMINESEAKNGGKVIVKGILQRAGSENQNDEASNDASENTVDAEYEEVKDEDDK